MTKPSEGSKELKEKLADIEHERWCDWQRWCHQILRQELPAEYLPKLNDVLDRWDRQIITRYDELTEKEKDSDREQVDRYWHLIEAHVKAEIRKTLERLKGESERMYYPNHIQSDGAVPLSAIDNEIKSLEER